MTGTVKRIVPERGFGFIEDSRGTEYFFHRSSVDNFDSLQGGETASFEPEDGPKGKRANNVQIGVAAAAESAAPEAPAAEATDAGAEAESAPVDQA
ncbi:MAG: cold shock domain-containing protein [Candidatus Dormiibacterota bacterium]